MTEKSQISLQIPDPAAILTVLSYDGFNREIQGDLVKIHPVSSRNISATNSFSQNPLVGFMKAYELVITSNFEGNRPGGNGDYRPPPGVGFCPVWLSDLSPSTMETQ